MIHFSLRCRDGHHFEGWFRSGTDFDNQAAAGHLTCPVCGDSHIEKAIMAPAITRHAHPAPTQPAAEPTAEPAATQPKAETLPAVAAPAPVVDERTAKMLKLMRRVQRHVEANFENVGKRFADEARKMHLGESEHRGVYGEATIEDARDLIEEGIDILPLPKLPKLDG